MLSVGKSDEVAQSLPIDFLCFCLRLLIQLGWIVSLLQVATPQLIGNEP